ncbi:hypothetical protein ACFY0A_39745 [Streptomyces sp. NPDC001698]|uniref:hypothetical protein n=1 Tax=Streptomyces sp. NPDC001698 TaxID=3364601 RepID=UPI0036C419FC
MQTAGARIMRDIERKLAQRNIGHLPPQLPRDRTRQVLLYNQDQPNLGAIVHMVRGLSAEQGAGDVSTSA